MSTVLLLNESGLFGAEETLPAIDISNVVPLNTAVVNGFYLINESGLFDSEYKQPSVILPNTISSYQQDKQNILVKLNEDGIYTADMSGFALPSTTASPTSKSSLSSLLVTLSCNVPATIYYTTDGTTPTTSSLIYSAPITIASNATVKYFAVDNYWNIESVKTQTYKVGAGTYVWTRYGFTANNGAIIKTAYGNGVYVGISDVYSGIYISSDCINWTRTEMPITGKTWYCLAFGAGLFVIIASSGGYCFTSPDGVVWTQRTYPSSNSIRVLEFGDGLFVSLGTNTFCATSPDGITWTQRTVSPDSQYSCLCRGNNVWVALGSSIISTSPDGITWTQRTKPCYSIFIVFGNGLFVIADYNGGTKKVYTSSNGVSWVNSAVLPYVNANCAAFGDGLFVILYGALPYNNASMSFDGITWDSSNKLTDDGNASYSKSLAYVNGRFLRASSGTTFDILTSTIPSLVTTATPIAGSYASTQYVTLSNKTPQVTIYYTTDGSTPDSTSLRYAYPIEISEDTTLKYYAFDLQGNKEEVKTSVYIMAHHNIVGVGGAVGGGDKTLVSTNLLQTFSSVGGAVGGGTATVIDFDVRKQFVCTGGAVGGGDKTEFLCNGLLVIEAITGGAVGGGTGRITCNDYNNAIFSITMHEYVFELTAWSAI